MQVLVVLAHPNGDSFNHAVAARACTALRIAGHEPVLLDLYPLGFGAAMTADERAAYHTNSPILDPLVRDHAELVKTAEGLVFVYPTWWSGQPAVLKGWLERVLVPGIGFEFNEKGKVRPGLTHIKQMVGISTYGSPWRYVKLVNDNGRRTLMRTIRINTGWRTRTSWLGLYAIDTSTDRDREAFIARVERRMRAM